MLNIEIVCWRENNIKGHLNPSSTVYSTSTVGSRGVEGKCVDFDFFFLFYWLIQKKIEFLWVRILHFFFFGRKDSAFWGLELSSIKYNRFFILGEANVFPYCKAGPFYLLQSLSFTWFLVVQVLAATIILRNQG